MAYLLEVTSIVNLIGLSLSIWLGWYIVTRSSRRLVVWLTSLTLWSISGIFLNMLLALNPPPAPEHPIGWLRILLPFWSARAFETGWSDWLAGWMVIPAIALWHHATALMHPKRPSVWKKAQIALVYGVTLSAIYFQVRTPSSYSSPSGDPLYLNTLKLETLHPIYYWLLIVFVIVSIFNLYLAGRSMAAPLAQRQFKTLIGATIIAGLTGPVTIIAHSSSLLVPRVALSALLGMAVILIGYGVARYSALLEGRTIRRDFLYNFLAISLVTLVYLGITSISVSLFDIPAAAFVLVIILAITTHSLIDSARQSLDTLFFRRDVRQVRAHLRNLTASVGEQNLEEALAPVLSSLCDSVQAIYGVILQFENGAHRKLAGCRWNQDLSNLPLDKFSSDDVIALQPGQFGPPLEEAALLVPLYSDTDQVGALVLGRPVNGLHYPEVDVGRILELSDRIADAISAAKREMDYLTKAAQIAPSRSIQVIQPSQKIPAKAVEDALRNVYDYAHLGDSVFAGLTVVISRLPADADTHIDRGKIVYEVIKEGLEKLRPNGRPPREPAPREWHSYLILHEAYFEDQLNRNIMSKLYISEGTFNRTRRSALRTLARVLDEMEAAAN